MDPRRFDELTRAMAGATTRRSVLRGVAAGVAGALAGIRPGLAAKPTKPGNGPCTPRDGSCAGGETCCRGTVCAGGVCCPEALACGGVCCQAGAKCVDGACSASGGGSGAGCPAGSVRIGPNCLLVAGQPCGQGAACQTGICADGVCCDSPCTGQCEACNVSGSLGSCAGLSGAPCDDGDPCSKDDICTNGVCAGTPYTCAPTECQASSVCDGVGGCTTTSKGNGESCEAGDPCTDDTCQNGECVTGSATDCSAEADECNDGVCDADSGGCVKRPKEGAPACDDGRGRCYDGVCCDAGPNEEAREFCDPTTVIGPTSHFNGICCADGVRCCGNAGCCDDCFLSIRANFTDPQYHCCAESQLCGPRSTDNPEPPFCCVGGQTCVIGDGPAGCYPSDRVCEGKRCPEPCCGGTCCAADERCSGGVCLKDNRSCEGDGGCDPGEACVGIAYEGDGTVATGPGTCCPWAYVCGGEEPEFPGRDTSCCAYGKRCSFSDPPQCCAYGDQGCRNCICSPRGGFTRL